MPKILKKIEVGNPLINLEMWNLYSEHEALKTDEQLASFYHKLLDILEVFHMCNRKNPLFESFIYSMIAFSTGQDESPLYFLMQQTLRDHEA